VFAGALALFTLTAGGSLVGFATTFALTASRERQSVALGTGGSVDASCGGLFAIR
jgi:hypothetical protein